VTDLNRIMTNSMSTRVASSAPARRGSRRHLCRARRASPIVIQGIQPGRPADDDHGRRKLPGFRDVIQGPG
jgi:hypothetical protein